MTLEKIEKNGELLALIIRDGYEPTESNFISDISHSFQVGVHKREKGFRYRAHTTLPFMGFGNLNPNKVYLVKSGKIGVDIYDKEDLKVSYVELFSGDMIIFISGGHGVDILEEGKFIEIKQGPYRREGDKRFLE